MLLILIMAFLAHASDPTPSGPEPVADGAAQGAAETRGSEGSEGSEEADIEEPAAPTGDLGGGWIDLAVPVDFGSALEGVSADVDAGSAVPGDGESAEGAAEVDLMPTTGLLRARWGVRPYLGLSGLDGAWSGAAGASIGHQWWSLRERVVSPAGQTELRASAPFGAIQGWELRLDSTHGAWLGPVGLLVGPALRADALHSQLLDVPASLTLGPQARLAVRAGPLTPWAAISPGWRLVGERPLLPDSPWHELAIAGGLSVDGKPLGMRLSGERRRLGATDPQSAVDMGAATAWQVALGVHLRML